MAKAKKKKYSASDKAILGIGYVLLGAFVLSILVPLLYVVIASFMDPNVDVYKRQLCIPASITAGSVANSDRNCRPKIRSSPPRIAPEINAYVILMP